MQPAKIIIFSAPSGAGKGTIIRKMMQDFPELSFSVSATSRAPREGEKDGQQYYFVSEEEFKRRIDSGEFIEWEQYSGHYYGTLKKEIARLAETGKVAVFEVEVRGATHLKEFFGEHALWIFIKAPLDLIKERLIARGTDTPEAIELRLETAKKEITYESHADTVIENIDLTKAFADCNAVISKFLNK